MKFEIIKPTFLVDKEACKKNIKKISSRINDSNSIFRPHFKTHQSLEIGRWFRDSGIRKIAVSSLEMALYFSEGGWDDIIVAFPANLPEIEKVNTLSSLINLNLLVESKGIVSELNKLVRSPLSVFIKIDVGYHRTGILPGNTDIIDEILKEIKSSERISFSGFLGHAGHSYKATSVNGILQIHSKSTEMMLKLKERYLNDFPGIIISLGDTPTASIANDFYGIDEVRPGNFVFYDLMQEKLGSCELSEIAVALAVPVVSKHQNRMEIVVYGGAVHLSKEGLAGPDGEKFYGYGTKIKENGWEIPDKKTFVSSLTQEHGVLKCSKKFFSEINTGDVICIIPVHSCLTANLAGSYREINGGRIEKFRR